MKIKSKLLTISFILFGTVLFAQNNITVSGTVTDDQGQPLPGASVILMGTTTGTQTDFDGNYSLDNIPDNGTLSFSYIGFSTQEIPINGQTTINVSLQEDTQALDEVVVVGYGEMKVKDLTSAITTVDSEVLDLAPVGQPMQALQGRVAGVQIVNSGGPGQSPTVRVRGVGSYDNNLNDNDDPSRPLFVVDGMFFDNIDFLNPADITSISVLKDASAAAIYGVRAANGVVLIETKSGSYNQKAEFTYNGYTGYQVPQNILKMANAEQFTTLAVESESDPDIQFILNAMQRYGRSRVNPNVPDVNTDWYDEVMRLAPIQSHSLGMTGGSENATYAIGANYFEQGGILAMKNDYERFNLRAKIDFKVNDWLKVGGNTVISNATRFDAEDSAWRLAYYAVPILPVYDPMLANDPDVYPINYANAQDLGYRGGQNPFPTMDFSENREKIRNFLANFYAEVDLVPEKLKFKTAYNYNFKDVNRRELRFDYFIGNNFQREDRSILKRITNNIDQIWDNTLTFTDSFGKHNLTAMVGTSFRDEAFELLQVRGLNFPLTGPEAYFIDQIPSDQITIEENGTRFTTDGGAREYGFSYFGRISYNFDNRYLLYGTFRADGTNKYQEKWGYFPTIGAGWVLSEEAFFPDNNTLTYLKLRGGWGELGNDNVPASSGSITSEDVTTALGDIPFSGILTRNDFEYLKWESTEELNIGLSARMFDNNLSIEADYYIRDTKEGVIPVERVLIPGTTRQNIGEIRNSGFELALNWNKRVSDDFSYTVGANLGTLKNEVLNLGDAQFLDAGTAEFRQRSIVGEPLFAFYGREIIGVYQNDAQVQADPVAVANNLEPGDFIYRDINGDGDITDDDRTVLGSFLPTYTFGFNIGLNYKAWDFSASAVGQGGNSILNRKRGEVIFTNDTNWDRDFAINRWHGEGTTNSYPSSKGIRKSWNQRLNNWFVEDGDFIRVQNITLGYTINKDGSMDKVPQIRIYATAEKPFTFFDYNGFNPEVSNGVDNQTYPIPAVYTIGVNVKI
ncbi:SusC/RagA family TonB-linked outer membrane protein [Allomuricauda sp. CP2A]|jgi:TonB-linked SusC/RagA family outer membrane protein|uniref:SusC/RagA family TonB-linked outer membrane protein n=1 Tax=Allomuricauda sp. CP2A TaxID=1848189 RepID=UPI00082C7A52|nr:TonB-dependent receptor [Muricauda sp. CP2A]